MLNLRLSVDSTTRSVTFPVARFLGADHTGFPARATAQVTLLARVLVLFKSPQ